MNNNTLVATYDYFDHDGKLLYQACRYEPKDFRQRRPDGQGGWIWNMENASRVPYRLPQLISANSGDTICIVEGEKDADNLVTLGFVATTNVGGAGKWKEEYNQYFANRKVCILPDNDDAGQKHANKVAKALNGVAAEIKILMLPNLPPKGDVSDWMATGGTAEELKRLIRESIEGWPLPTPFFTYNLPIFPSDALPDWQRQWVEAEAEATQTPLDLSGVLALCVTATTVARKFEIQIRSGWREPLNLYGIIGLDPGNRKSAVFRDASMPIEEKERNEIEAMKNKIIESNTRRQVLEARLERAKKEAAKAKDQNKRAQLTEDAILLANELERTPILAEPQYIADDCTTEKLGSLLATHHSRIGILSAEGDIFDIMAGRYSKGQPNIGIYLKAHAGDQIKTDRIGRPSEFINRPALTLALTVQLSVIQGLATKPGFKGRGLLARILYSLPESPIGSRNTNPTPIPKNIKDNYYNNVINLLSLPWREDGEPHIIQLSVEARHLFDDFHMKTEKMLFLFGKLGSMQDWGGKLMGAIARIAGNLHLAENIGKSTLWDIALNENTMRCAIKLGEYFTPHAKAAIEEMGADPATEDARYILRWLERHGVSPVTKRDIHQGTKGRFRYAKRLEPGLTMLVDHDYIRLKTEEETTNRGPGQPPSPTYEINPAILTGQTNSEDSENIEDSVLKSFEREDEQNETESSSSLFSLSSESKKEHDKVSTPETLHEQIPNENEEPTKEDVLQLFGQPHQCEYQEIDNITRCVHCGGISPTTNESL